MNMVLFYWMLIIVMVVWMAVKVGRNSVGLGVVTFFFWPIAIIPLITNWGQRDSDIRLQFFVTLIATGLLWKAMIDVVVKEVPFSEDEIAMIREENPAFAAQLEREQARRDSGGVEFVVESDPGSASTSASISVVPSSRSPRVQEAFSGMPQAPGEAVAPLARSEPGMQYAAAPAKVHATPLHEIRFRRGDVRLAPAFAMLEVPRHFRFIARHQLGLLSQLRGVPVTAQTLGWIVHERVNLNSADFWFVEIGFHEVGHIAAPTPAAPASGIHWNADRLIAQWSQPPKDARRGEDYLAAKLLRHGVISLRVPELVDGQRELGIRATRLMAERIYPESGWAHSEYIGDPSQLSLAGWVQSQQSGAEATVTAEATGDRERS